MINEEITFSNVRLITSEGEMVGVVPIEKAMAAADEAGLDLVCISPNPDNPVCRVMDYGKYLFEQGKREKEAKKKQKVIEIKEVRLSPNINTNDLMTKVNAARKFIGNGDKVKVTLRFRGREMSHMNQTKQILDVFAEKMQDIATIEKPSKLEGRSLIMILSEKK